jgi:hypothetical protein
MPNPIKYSTGSETNALKKGNFYIGTGSEGKGPSDVTGYYNGVTPQTGGYVIYMFKDGAPGNLSYHSAANDSELISFTSGLAGQTYTGVSQCFDYYAGQTDKVMIIQEFPSDYPLNYPNIVMPGLILNLDAGITQSYPGSGTTWTDINGLGPNNNGTLTNGPTFNTDGGGSIMFDGVDDYVTLGPDFGSINGPEFSYGIIFYWDGTNMNRGLMGKRNSSPFNQYNIGVRGGPNNPASSNVLSTFNAPDNAENSTLYAQMQYTLPFEGWYYAIVNIKTTVQRLYVNGVLRSSDTRNYTNRTFNITGRNFYVGTVTSDNNTPGLLWNNKIAIVHLYDRSLSDSEIQQNYNALKGRFGL